MNNLLDQAPLCVVDVGCAGGIDPTWRHAECGGAMFFFGFEASPEQFAKLADNSASFHQIAVSNRDGELEFHASGTVGSVSERPDREQLFGESFTKVTVQCRTLISLRAEGVVPSLDVLKIDVEGHELEVLEGAKDLLKNETVAVKLEFPFDTSKKGSFVDLHSLLGHAGFRLFGLSYGQDLVGAIEGGDGIYLMSIENILEGPRPRQRVIKAFANAICIRQFDYARILVTRATENGIIEESEARVLRRQSDRLVALTDIFPFSFGRAAAFAGLLSQLLAGRYARAKSTPKSNRLVPSKRLFIPINRFFRAKQRLKAARVLDVHRIKYASASRDDTPR
ncbi:MAG: FkbM family methyltransferase [Alphaproteobacteria bacterium]